MEMQKQHVICLGVGALPEGEMWGERIAEKQFGTDFRGHGVSC